MKIAKEFYWEMGHRLPHHKGLCKNLHGHSYKMCVELEGSLDKNNMIIDYFDLTKIVNKIIEPLNHAFLCEETDHIVRDFLINNNFKVYLVPFVSTAENIALHLLKLLKEQLKSYKNIERIKVRLCETNDVYAEASDTI